MKSCFILYDIAITILEQMKPSKEQVILFFAGLFFVLPGSSRGMSSCAGAIFRHALGRRKLGI